MSEETAQILIAGPAVVARAMGEQMTKEELGGAKVHARNGTIDNAAKNEIAALEEIKTFLSYMPSNVWELPPVTQTDDPIDRQEDMLLDIVPHDRRRAFDMRRVIAAVFDLGSFFEMGKGYGRSQILSLIHI